VAWGGATVNKTTREKRPNTTPKFAVHHAELESAGVVVVGVEGEPEDAYGHNVRDAADRQQHWNIESGTTSEGAQAPTNRRMIG